MNWFKKLFGKRDNSGEETVFREIGFEELPAWLDARSQKLFSGMERDVQGILRNLESAILELKESSFRLAEAKVEGDFDVRAVKRAKSNRENVTKQVAALVDKIKVQEYSDFKALGTFYETAVQNFETCLEHMDRSLKYTRAVFPQESKDVNESFSRLGRTFKELREAIQVNKGEIEAIEAAALEIKEIRNLSAEIAAEEQELESRKGKIQALNEEIARTNRAFADFKNGESWKELQHQQEELDAANNRLKKAEANLSTLVLPLSGHLSRIQKLHESGRYTLRPDVKHQLDICLESPALVDPVFFTELQKLFEDKALDMQAQKKEKALQQVKALISIFPERKKEYLEALREFEAKQARIPESDTRRLIELEHKEKELLSRTRLLEGDIINSEKKLAVLRGELKNQREILLGNINFIDSGVKLDWREQRTGNNIE